MRTRTLALICSLLASTGFAETLKPIGMFVLESDSIAGVSGIEVSDDGSSFLAVSDQGWWIEGKFERRGELITNVELERILPIIGQDGRPVSARRVGDWSDAEGLAIHEDGTLYVSFERWAHVWSFSDIKTKADWIKDHPTFYDHAENWQLEAIAIDPSGSVYAFSEKPLPEGFPIYKLGPDRLWTIEGYLPEQDVFAIVGADFADDGSLYILERKLVVGLWWQNQIRRVRLDGSEDQILWTGERGEYENLEGISVWEDEGGLRLTMVSDNNARENTPTQFVEFRLTE